MPIYEFECQACGERFEELVGADAVPPCPACGGEARRLLSQIGRPLKFGLRGGDARRSNATRSAREERKREERAAKRERDAKG